MRIVTLLPSATEIVCALGLQDSLIGVSHECDYPPHVATLPKLTRSAIPQHVAGSKIDRAVSETLKRGDSLYQLNEELLAALQPDLVITQELCDVCAVSFSDVQRLAARLPNHPNILSLNPPNLDGIFQDIETVAAATHTIERGQQLKKDLCARIERVQARVNGLPRPRVFALEWLDPPFAAGHWVPEMIALAGGDEVLGQAGVKSFRVTWEDVIAAQPNFIFLIPCGYARHVAQREWDALPKPRGWETIPAAQTGRVFALEADSYCSRPAPRVVDGIEQIAAFLHPEATANG